MTLMLVKTAGGQCQNCGQDPTRPSKQATRQGIDNHVPEPANTSGPLPARGPDPSDRDLMVKGPSDSTTSSDQAGIPTSAQDPDNLRDDPSWDERTLRKKIDELQETLVSVWEENADLAGELRALRSAADGAAKLPVATQIPAPVSTYTPPGNNVSGQADSSPRPAWAKGHALASNTDCSAGVIVPDRTDEATKLVQASWPNANGPDLKGNRPKTRLTPRNPETWRNQPRWDILLDTAAGYLFVVGPCYWFVIRPISLGRYGAFAEWSIILFLVQMARLWKDIGAAEERARLQRANNVSGTESV